MDVVWGVRTSNCYVQIGNSYLMEWAADFVRAKRITSNIGADHTAYDGQSIKGSEIDLSSVSKILQAGWIWHPNGGLFQK